MHIIVRKTTRERAADLARSRRGDAFIRGEVRTSEEAFETARALERETGEQFTKPFAVSNGSREAKQAEKDSLLQQGINPETWEPLHSKSTSHE